MGSCTWWFEKYDKMNCPICGNELIFYKSVMRGFSWSNPFMKCNDRNCGFIYIEELINHGRVGNSCFEQDKYQKNCAEHCLSQKFQIRIVAE